MLGGDAAGVKNCLQARLPRPRTRFEREWNFDLAPPAASGGLARLRAWPKIAGVRGNYSPALLSSIERIPWGGQTPCS